jgi:hypothetical protein
VDGDICFDITSIILIKVGDEVDVVAQMGKTLTNVSVIVFFTFVFRPDNHAIVQSNVACDQMKTLDGGIQITLMLIGYEDLLDDALLD